MGKSSTLLELTSWEKPVPSILPRTVPQLILLNMVVSVRIIQQNPTPKTIICLFTNLHRWILSLYLLLLQLRQRTPKQRSQKHNNKYTPPLLRHCHRHHHHHHHHQCQVDDMATEVQTNFVLSHNNSTIVKLIELFKSYKK